MSMFILFYLISTCQVFFSFTSLRTIVRNSCLKSYKTRPKKSVHFDWHLSTDVPSTLSTNINTEEKKKNDSETIKEKEKIETARRTINPTTPLTTSHTIHRSFSLSPSPLSKEENNYNRRHRQVKKENVDELNCTTTTSGSNSRRVTFNNNISTIKKLNGMKNSNGSMFKSILLFF